MVSCKKLSGSASRSLCLPLLHHVRHSEKNIAISRILREVFPQPRTKPAVRPLPLPRVGDPKCFLSASQDKMLDMVFLSS